MRHRRVHLVGQRGGHLELLRGLHETFDGCERVWVTEAGRTADSLVAAGERVETVRFFGRNPLRALGNLADAIRVVVRTRPSVVVCSGAGQTVPFCLVARLFGAHLIFVETMARVTGPSASGRILSRIASSVLVQWPGMKDVYPRTTVCRPVLLEGVTSRPRPGGAGTFVAVGTWSQPFDRLLRMVDDAAGRGVLPGPVVMQTGVSGYVPRHCEARAFMSPAELEASIEAAEVVVCHAGSGLLSSALRAGRRPLVLPRLAGEREHVDDHQLQIAGKLAEYQLVVLLEDGLEADHVVAARATLPPVSTELAGQALQDALRHRVSGALQTAAAA